MPRLRVQFVHGLEGSPQGSKARLLAAHFDALTPSMDTRDFEAAVAVQAEAARAFVPDVLVGSSFGGAVALAMLQRGHWRGPTLLLAQAAVRMGLEPRLPRETWVWLVHGVRDELIDLADSRTLAASGCPEHTRLIEVDDDHPLHASVADGSLVRWISELAAAARAAD